MADGKQVMDDDGLFFITSTGLRDICELCCSVSVILTICKAIASFATNNTRASPSMVVVDGNPAVAYYYSSNSSLRFIRATDANGYAWGSAVTINNDSGNEVGMHASMAIVDGYPATSFWRGYPHKDIMYARATNAAGSAWGSAVTVSTRSTDYGTRLRVIDGRPAIAFVESGKLYYIRADDATGSSWPSGGGTQITGATPQYFDFLEVDGRPALVWHHNNTDLAYLRADDSTGSAWTGTVLYPDTTGNVGYQPSIAIVDGYPAIAYKDQTNTSLKYVRATNAAGSAWGTPVTVNNDANTGDRCSLAVINGNPAISYQSNSVQKYVRATNTSGSAWGSPISTGGGGGNQITDLVDVNGRPAVASGDTGSNVEYCRSADADGTSWTLTSFWIAYDGNGHTSGTVPSGPLKTYAIDATLQTNYGSLAKSGSTFDGWNTQADGLGDDYAEGATLATDDYTTFYAKWI